jgi:2-polyprenyl-3-methyl-5-hydroxy-6-metoxy-1,4-benzoquinol methylase
MNISSSKIAFFVFNKLRKWVDHHRNKLRQHKNIVALDMIRTVNVCPACKGGRVFHLADIPYSETFLNKWNGSVSDLYKIVHRDFLHQCFPYEFCEECLFSFQSATKKGFAETIENNSLVNERVLSSYEKQTQVTVNLELIQHILSENENLSTIEGHYKWLINEMKPFISPASKILDLGCNRGTFAEVMRKIYLDSEVWGCEINQTYAAACRSRYPNLNLIEEPLSENKKHGSFDLIFCSDVIEHIWDLDGFIKSIKNNLNPSGKIMFVTPNLMCATAVRGGINWWGYMPPHHTQLFSAKSLSKLLARHGFKQKQTSAFGDEFASVFQLDQVN